MLEFLSAYNEIISSCKVTRYEQYGNSMRLRMEVCFKDGSMLFVRETILHSQERIYAYHWQASDNTFLVRWDNAAHWDVETSPHHKHIGSTVEVEPSYERTLEQVLKAIASALK